MEQNHRLTPAEHRVPDLNSVYGGIAIPIGTRQYWRRRQGHALRLSIHFGLDGENCEDREQIEKRSVIIF
jgi:hypothetical protein